MWHIIAIQRARWHVWMVDVDLALGTRQTLEDHLVSIDVVRIAIIPRPDRHAAVAATEIDSLGHAPLLNAPSTTRTCDLRFRRPLLYPAELPGLGGHNTGSPLTIYREGHSIHVITEVLLLEDVPSNR